MEITATMVKELRQLTGAGMMDCKAALKESAGDVEKAIEYMRVRGLAKAQKKSGRETSEGMVYSYIHAGGRIGVLVQIDCETDFVARTDEFKRFAHDVAMQVAAAAPLAVRRENLPQQEIEKERNVYREQALEAGKPDKIVDKIVDGKIDKYYSEVVLMDQVFIKDDSKSVGDLLAELVTKLGENIKVSRFARFQIGS
ncbi:MAG: translation elongation factor Ts [bacterium]|nr:translation elongation factor Ts [bacterium]